MAGTFDGTDWSAVDTGAGENRRIKWFTQTYDENINANALRWGSTYNFRFDADTPPQEDFVNATLVHYRGSTEGPGAPDSLTVRTLGPLPGKIGCAADFNGDGQVGAFDLANLLGHWDACADCPYDLDGDGSVGPNDLAILLAAWGPCQN